MVTLPALLPVTDNVQSPILQSIAVQTINDLIRAAAEAQTLGVADGVSVVAYGADPTGVLDSQPAFKAAIESFSASGSSYAGTVIVPYGKYRLSSTVSIKRSVNIRGVQGASPYLSCWICPDRGITAFTAEYYNTPLGTTDAGSSSGCTISGLIIQPASKTPAWVVDTAYAVGDRRRCGTGRKTNWRRHYECVTAGVSSSSGTGPGQPPAWTALTAYVVGHIRLNGTDGNAYICTTAGTSAASGGPTGISTSIADGSVIWDATNDIGSLGFWASKTSYRVGDRRMNGATNLIYRCTVAGTSAASGGPSGTGDGITDGSVTWNYFGTANIDNCLFVDGTVTWKYIGGAHGIKMRANTNVQNVNVFSTCGNGIHIENADPEAPGAFTNSNAWSIFNTTIYGADGHGLYVNGSDVNGGAFTNGFMNANGAPGANGIAGDEELTGTGFNIFESSFLGNTYTGIIMQSGGLGSIFADSSGGGNVFVGCYQEGTGGGPNQVTGSCVIVGGGLAYSQFSPDSTPLVLAGGGLSRANGAMVAGYGGYPWRPSVIVPVGKRSVNGANLYECITAGTTASSGGPTGTAADITDGTAHWMFVHATTDNGNITLGSADPTFNVFSSFQGPADVNVGLPIYNRYTPYGYGGVTNAVVWQYGPSGPNPAVIEGNGLGLMMAVNSTFLTEWPMHVPAGKALFDQLWVGGCRIMYGTALPADGSFNPGDRLYYKGAACVSGGVEGQVCTTGGTLGTYTGGRTATATGITTITISGAAMPSFTDQQHFKTGDKLVINGVTSTVQSVSSTGLSLVMGLAIPAGAGLAIAFVAPVFKNFGSIA